MTKHQSRKEMDDEIAHYKARCEHLQNALYVAHKSQHRQAAQSHESATSGKSVLNPRADILAEAEGLVNGDRNAQYGDPNQDFARTAAMWNSYISGVFERKMAGNDPGETDMMQLLDTWDVAWMMVILKASRATTSPLKRDHYADAAGYVACGFDCSVGGVS